MAFFSSAARAIAVARSRADSLATLEPPVSSNGARRTPTGLGVRPPGDPGDGFRALLGAVSFSCELLNRGRASVPRPSRSPFLFAKPQPFYRARPSYEKLSGSNAPLSSLPVPVDDPLKGRQTFESHRSPPMQLARSRSDLRSEPHFAAIVKT